VQPERNIVSDEPLDKLHK